jgi:indole-3-glycerol phosphate synthase
VSDFLEQVVAERRADVAGARAIKPHETLLEGTKDHVWAYATRTGDWGAIPINAIAGKIAVRHGDAFTARLASGRTLGQLAVIAEVKRISPALGTLASDIDPGRQAKRYAAAGATAISVLTEPRHWGGSLRDLAAVRDAVGPTVPVLCKDIIVSEYQIAQARAAGADAVLLIAEVLSEAELRRFIAYARELNMGALVEAHEPAAFGRAVACGALVVGANARDLRHPSTIDITRARQLHTFVRADQIFVAESGIESADDARLLPARVDAVLVGTALMRSDDPAPIIRALASIPRRATVGATLAER